MRRVRPPNSDYTIQSFNDGIVAIYAVVDGAAPGRKPVMQLRPIGQLHYEEQKLGIKRYYTAMQNHVQVERVIRVPAGFNISPQQVAVTEDGAQYSINMVQTVREVSPSALDLTLACTVQKYEVTNAMV